jgi:hypothetical protein
MFSITCLSWGGARLSALSKALLAEHQPDAVQKNPQANVKQRLDRFADFVETSLADWSNHERTLAHRQLSVLLDHISQSKTDHTGRRNQAAPTLPRFPALEPLTEELTKETL